MKNEKNIRINNKTIEEMEGDTFSDLHDLLNTIKLRVYNDMTDEEDEQFDIDVDYHEYNCDEDDYDPDDVSEAEAEFTVTDSITGEEEVIDGIIIDFDHDNGQYSL
jgi:hypothetical protein